MKENINFKKIFYIKKGEEKNISRLKSYLLASFYVDLFDFHSKVKISRKFLISTPLIRVDSDITWTNDMFNLEAKDNLKKLEEENPNLNILIPEFYLNNFTLIDELLYNSIVKFFKIKIFKNRKVSLFSQYGEDLKNFKKRCFKFATEKYEDEIENLKRITEIKFEHLKEKFDKKEYVNELEREKVRDSFFEARRFLEKIFLSPILNIEGKIPLSNEASQDLTELLETTLKKLESIREDIKRESEEIEPYLISLTPKNISDFKVDLLWK